jgi:hypothetical protein
MASSRSCWRDRERRERCSCGPLGREPGANLPAAAERGIFVYVAEHDVGYVLVAAPETPASVEALEPWSGKLSPRCRYPTASWHQMSVVSPSLVAPLA